MATGCNDATQQATWCPTTTDEALPAVLGLLPEGPAWDGAHQAGTVANTFWRAISNTVGWAYGQLCEYMNEFYCNTATLSLDQWMTEYGLPDECDPFGYSLCAKATMVGGADCEFFTAVAAANGWSITCTSVLDDAMAGAIVCGCSPLGPASVIATPFTISLPVQAPGSGSDPNTIYFGPPAAVVPAGIVGALDSSGKFSTVGNVFTWGITVNLAESASYVSALAGAALPPFSIAGDMTAGCTPTDFTGPDVAALTCFLNELVPAHTSLVVSTAA